MRPLLLAALLALACGAPPAPAATQVEQDDPATLLAAMAASPEGPARRPMLQAIRRAPAEQALPALRAALASPDPALRAAAAVATGRRRDGLGLAPTLLTLATDDPVPAVRVAAGRGLGGLRHPDAFPTLQRNLSDGTADVRLGALRALARLDPERAATLPELGRLQLDPDARIAGTATKVARRVPIQ